MSTNMSSIVHDANEFGYIRPTRWNLTNNNNVPTEHDDDAPITQSVDINSTLILRPSSGNTIPRGVPVAKGFQVGKQFNYQPKAPKTNSDGGSTREVTSSKVGSSSYSNEGASHKVTSIDKQNDKDVVDTGAMKISNISSPNPFTVLGEVEDEDEDIENVYDESENLNLNHNPGASTPAQTVPDVYYDMCKNNLVGHAGLMRNRPWVLLGDFNAALNIEDHSSGGYESNVAMRDFKECVQVMEVADVNSTGLHFTWNQKPKGSNGILKNINRIMGAELKSPFRKLLHNHGNLHERVNKIRIELDEAQKAIDRDPSSSVLRSGPDGFSAAFFKKAWDVVSGDVTLCIRDFFLNGVLPVQEFGVNDWRNKFLSLADRLQLIRSVLSSMHIYWASVFILPSHIVHDLEQIMHGFLWCQREIKKGKAKVAWDSVCMPKHEGGLGIRRIEDFNIALMATYIWNIFTHRESLWVKWVHHYKLLKVVCFLDVPVYEVGCQLGMAWTDVCPLKDLISNRDIIRSSFSLENSDCGLREIEVGYFQVQEDVYQVSFAA
ncbi:RNA-directed DNA polymerase, eukaryota, reverse transcriptase zinc-binding domain protein [Tanacetum coccineum]